MQNTLFICICKHVNMAHQLPWALWQPPFSQLTVWTKQLHSDPVTPPKLHDGICVVKSAHCNSEHYTVPKWVVEFDSVQTSSNSGLLNSTQPICQACYHLPLQQNQKAKGVCIYLYTKLSVVRFQHWVWWPEIEQKIGQTPILRRTT
jgi:hypothetical protein